MSWSDNDGGNPWSGSRKAGKPSGKRASGGGGSSNGSGGGGFGGGSKASGTGPDAEAMISALQAKLRSFFSEGGWQRYFFILLIILGLWLASGFYRIEQGQIGLPLIFGKYTGLQKPPGLNYNLPRPIGQVFKVDVERSRRQEIGYRGTADVGRVGTDGRDVPEESLMLTGDQNIVDIDLAVLWKIKDPELYVFNIRDPEATVKIAAESAIREVVGQSSFDRAVTDGRAEIETRTRDVLQDLLDSYGAGIEIETIDMQKSDPPEPVIDSFNDVQRARQDLDRLRNEAEAYANTIIPQARGEAEQLIRQAEGYRERLIKEAEGEAARFVSIYESYRLSPEVTRRRLYLETIAEIFGKSDKIIIDEAAGGTGVIPYLPLPELGKRRPSSSADTQSN